MAYANAQQDPREKWASMLVVGGLHAAVGIGLATALAITVELTPPEENVVAINTPVDVPTTPPDPIEDVTDPIIPPSTPAAPIPRVPLPKDQPFEVSVAREDPILDVGALPTPIGDPIVLPPDPGPTFTPTRALPRNGPQGWITTDDYPRGDLNRGNEGTARYTLTINTRGRVENCSVISSTGHSGLDRATCRHIERRARFDPALNGEQKPVAGTYTGVVTWQIPE